MPVVQMVLSNLSGEPIPKGTGARVRIMWGEPDRPDMRIDLTQAEAEKLAKAYKAEEVEIRPERRGPKK